MYSAKPMKLVSLNVNGIRAFEEKSGTPFNNFCKQVLGAEIVCLQEIKGSESNLLKFHSLVDYQTFSSFYKGGRHGVSTLVSKRLFCGKVEEIIPGRILKTYHGSFVLYNCYLPYYDENKEGDKAAVIEVYEKFKALLPRQSVIICGDLNATYSMLDHFQFASEIATLVEVNSWVDHPTLIRESIINGFRRNRNLSDGMRRKLDMCKSMESRNKSSEENGTNINSIAICRVNKANPSKIELPYHFFDIAELEKYFYEVYQRRWMRDLVNEYTDTFRVFNKGLSKYTCWNTIFNLRKHNLGTRIDYILCSKDLNCIGAGIMPEVKGSDHCPTYAEFDLETCNDGRENLVERRNNLISFFR